MPSIASSAALRLPSSEAVQAERARRSLRRFAEQAWPVLEPATAFVPGWHIDAVCEHLEAVTDGHIRRLLITMPPRHMKSLLVAVFWPVWVWATTPEVRWLYSSYAQSLSTRDSVKCRDLILSSWYRSRWGNVFALKGDQNEKLRFENTRTGYRIATSVGGSATGEGGDILVCDDPHQASDAYSEAVRTSVLNWADQTWSTRQNDPKKSAQVIVQQRVHMEDLAGHVLEQGEWVHLNLPAEYEPGRRSSTVIGWSDPRTKPGELLWPAKMGSPELAGYKKSLGSYGYAGQFQQRPSPMGGGVVKRQWLRFWVRKGVQVPPVRVLLPDGSTHQCQTVALPDLDRHLQSWDMTFKDKKTSDYVVGQVWGGCMADSFLLDQVRDRMNFPAAVQAVRDLTSAWPIATRKLIEDTANGPAVIATLNKEIGGLIPVTPKGGKLARLAAVTPSMESGNVYLPHPATAPWVNELVEELAVFPAGAFDDQVDATSQALFDLQTGTPLAVSVVGIGTQRRVRAG